MYNTDSSEQGKARAAHMLNLNASLLEQLTAMFHDCSPYEQSFVSLGHCTTPINAPNLFFTVIYTGRHPAAQHVCRYIGSLVLKMAAIDPEVEDGIRS